MSRMSRVIAVVVCQALALITIASPQPRSTQIKSPEAAELERKIRRFVPTILTAETSRLSANDRGALQKIIAAAKLYDPLYLRQRRPSVYSSRNSTQRSKRQRPT